MSVRSPPGRAAAGPPSKKRARREGRKIGRPLLVVWDRLNAHRAHRTAAFLARHARDFAVAYLPAYAPDLNPEEPCNAWVKRILENALPGDIADLHRRVRRAFRRLQHWAD